MYTMAKNTTWTANLSKDLVDAVDEAVAVTLLIDITTMTTTFLVVAVDSVAVVDVAVAEVVVDPSDAFRDQGADISIEIGTKDR